MVKFKQKQYTQWDETDNLKRMKDSDILAEQKKKNPSRLAGALKTGGAGAVIGGVAGGILGMRKGGAGFISGMKKGAATGGVIGGIGGATMTGNKERSENNFYNDRLEYAQRQALRRERKDWKQNMTQREGYTFSEKSILSLSDQKSFSKWTHILKRGAATVRNGVRKAMRNPGQAVRKGVGAGIENPVAVTAAAAPIPGTTAAVPFLKSEKILPKKAADTLKGARRKFENTDGKSILSRIGNKVETGVNDFMMMAPRMIPV